MQTCGILGRKLGMTQVFDENGTCIAVTLIEAGPCVVLKSYSKGDIFKLQLGFEDVKKTSKENRIKKPQLGQFRKIKVAPKRIIKEVKFSSKEVPAIGSEITADIFKKGDYVDIRGTSIGKGFQGGMKRWHWAGGFKTHGSTSHRRVGSIGASAYPSRVVKGHHMPGHMGNRKVTTQNIKVIEVVAGDNLLVVKGAVVGHKNNLLVIQKAIKKHGQIKDNETK
ncbi:MAG: 50S ribosomal protein L3 [Candidatus Omnitrophica bacterium]|nr:50S ribosomal protein L3 [Candidatus Omnitrophota bacterium]